MSERRELDEREFAEQFQRAYERTSLPGPEARARIVAAARARASEPVSPVSRWLEPRTFTLRPIAAALAAITLVGAGALLALGLEHRMPRSAAGDRADDAATDLPQPTRAIRFVFVDRSASRVALVGDFNGWDAGVTPMRRDRSDGAWTISVPLSPGWHSYAFVVNGATWVSDPQAPLAPAEEFGTPRSVVVVGEHGT